jgi:hypothetical protein
MVFLPSRRHAGLECGRVGPAPMTIRFYNSLTQKLEAFEPLEPGKARVYVCYGEELSRPASKVADDL